MLSSHKLILNSGITFGTSGARGLVEDFTPDVCAAFALSFAEVMQNKNAFTTIAIAIDNRPSSYKMAQAISSSLGERGIEVHFFGVIPTPALAYYALQSKIPSIMVTGSHIPFDRNGLKFYGSDGEITKSDEVAILNADVEFNSLVNLPPLIYRDEAKSLYIKRNIDVFPSDLLVGKRIGIYEHSSAGRDIYCDIFESLGAEVIALGRSDEFVPIDTEAVSFEDKQLARAWVKEYKLNALFSTDGDGDRPLLSGENGEWLRGDVLGLICSKLLNIEALSTPVSCNSAIEKSNSFKSVVRTKIGSPYVIDEFENLTKKFATVAGFEANGGYLLASTVQVNGHSITPLPTRDAVLPAIVVLSQLQQTTISRLVKSLPQRFTASDRIKEFARDKSLQLIHNISQNSSLWLPKLKLSNVLTNIDKTDGFRMTFENGDIVHLRPSGNAPELRCYAECSNQEEAEKLVQTVLNAIKTL
ncbi:MAG: phosphomannomutase [Pseudoalteromonas sp.]|uniref:phosphomannomutase n=1 Tax=Pseudoalteromonas sp. TaxID=53249 RepID=UPI000C91E0C3|nr:phosphomannomutase [Pseudoalteromonas sp.]MAD02195.1 phosphomannomutase [Pseudoalteromonas sp.]|tara:strand:- start:47346 stop:48761 length:1416 start_codon:yes stop_codon:yes gene_type:complete